MALRALIAVDVVRSLGPRRILDGINLTAAPGDRIGLIGDNGVGKSTLLRLLAGFDEPDTGTVKRPENLGFLRQESPYHPRTTVQQILDDALSESRDILRRLESLSDKLAQDPSDDNLLAAYSSTLEAAQDHDVWDASRRADLVLEGLGLAGVPRARELSAISGGERGRLALGALLVRRPTALLLDEPTNHLDDAAVNFLETQLREMRGVVVVASHDRVFLDQVCTDLIDLDPAIAGPARFGGNYSAYQQNRQARRERWARRYADEQAELAELQHAVSSTSHEVAHGRPARDSEKMGIGHTAGRVQRQVSRRVRDAARRLAELERSQVPEPPAPLTFQVPALVASAAAGTVVSLRKVTVFGRLDIDRLDIGATDHLLVTGPNGAGKSTLLAVVAGIVPAEGRVLHRPDLRIGYLPQDSAFDRPDQTAQQAYDAGVGAERAESVPLGSLGLIAPTDATMPVGALSVGQRRRLALAVVLADPPDLLLLDEPTNHISPLLADELQNAFDTAPGAIVVASHDRWLRRRWDGPLAELTPVRHT